MSIPGYDVGRVPTLNRQQQKLQSGLTKGVEQPALQGVDYLSKLAKGEGEAYDRLEQPAFDTLQKAEGHIASRFSQGGARNSSAFRNAIAGAAGDVSSNLQQQRHQIQMDAILKLLGISENVLNRNTFQNVLIPEDESPNFGQGVGNLFAKIAPSLIKMIPGIGAPAGVLADEVAGAATGNKGQSGGNKGQSSGYKGSFGELPNFTGM